jgi:hypothetical protein
VDGEGISARSSLNSPSDSTMESSCGSGMAQAKSVG